MTKYTIPGFDVTEVFPRRIILAGNWYYEELEDTGGELDNDVLLDYIEELNDQAFLVEE